MSEARSVRALLYVANPTNPHFFLPEPKVAAQIIDTAVGPSGTNREYLKNLEKWLAEVGEEDAHVQELSSLMRKDVREDQPGTNVRLSPRMFGGRVARAVSFELPRVNGTFRFACRRFSDA